jgi:DNA topoisomerase VI subunit B
LKKLCHACQYISKKEMLKSNFTKWGYQNIKDNFQNFISSRSIEDMKRIQEKKSKDQNT